MSEKFALKVIELTAAIIEIKSYVRELERENKRLKAQNEVLTEMLKSKYCDNNEI